MGHAELLHSAFERQARATPERVAVSLARSSLTYAQLDRGARAFSYELRTMGVSMGATVGVCAQRSPELVVALLGVLKTGAAYLPLDPEDPPGRHERVLAAAKPSLVLVDGPSGSRLAARAEVPTIGLRTWGARATTAQPENELYEHAEETDLAYVIYTSGSTGHPKGVMGTHRGIVNRLRWMQRRYRLHDGEGVLHKTSLAFDVSLWEIFWPLSVGARVVLARPGEQRHPQAVADTICAERVSVVHFVPAMLTAFIAAGELERCVDLRAVMCSGEALSGRLRDLFHARSEAELHNLYGPTEAAVDVTHHTCRRGEASPGVPIGRAIDNVGIRVLDERQRPVKGRAVGEICIAGVALARGYLGRPGLTAERFVPDPLGDGERLYRTGDRGRMGVDGELEFLGRLDGQVKIRGVRVEPAEVEVALAMVPGVEHCAVAVCDADAEHPQLTAYVVARRATTEDLRKELGRTLPAQAVPSRFVYLDELPVLPNGKVDRASLAALYGAAPMARATAGKESSASIDGAAPGGCGVSPKTATFPAEATTAVADDDAGAAATAAVATLAEIWREVLGLAEVRASDNFFALGGDSIRSIEVVARARAADLELTTHDIFAYQTLAELARRTGSAVPAGALDGPLGNPFALIAARDREALPSGVCEALPLSSLLAGLVAESLSNPHYRVYTTTCDIEGPYDAGGLQEALAAVLDRHDFLRSAVELERFSEPLQLVYRSLDVAVREIDARGRSTEARARSHAAWLSHERRTHFDWSRPPLLRVTAHIYDGDRWRLTLSEPFLDGWSVTLVLAELLRTYRARLHDEQPTLPRAPRVCNRGVVTAERDALRSVAHRDFWKRYVGEGCATRLPRLAEEGGGTRRPLRIDVPIPEDVAHALAPVARDLGVPLKSVLLATHAWALAALSGQSEVLCGLMVNARPEGPGGERAVGLFLNTVPVRLRLERGSWAELIRAAHAAEAKILPWRRYPYAQIVRDAGGRTPFDSVFNFTHFHPYSELAAPEGNEVMRLVGVGGVDQTYLPLTAHFGIDPFAHDAVGLALEINPEGFSGIQVEQFVDLHARALAAIAAGVDSAHHALASIGPGESARRAHWHASGVTSRGAASRRGGVSRRSEAVRLEELFERRVRVAPDALAVFDDREGVSYEELDLRATGLMGAIATLCTYSPRRIGICMSHGPELPAAMLAALRLGAAFVPLDPTLPAKRLDASIAAAALDAILVDARGAEVLARLPAARTDKVLYIGGGDGVGGALTGQRAAERTPVEKVDAQPQEQMRRTAREGLRGSHVELRCRTAEDPAHILFTSGSSGGPKGVVSTHAAVVNRLRWMWRAHPFRPGEVVCARASIGFVDAVSEIFSGLLGGVPTFMLTQDLGDPDVFARGLRDAGVTRLTLVPALLRALLWRCDSDRRACLAGINHWVLSGEPLDGELLASLRRVVPRATVLNLYGSTEVAGDVTVYECGARERGLLPAGVAIDGMHVRVLDQYGRDAPCGTVGEVAVEGPGLATGYLDDPRATAERFRPTARGLGRRMLLTGDLGRHRPEGILEVLGRRDRQIQVNGVRVEPAEVEAALLSHPRVRVCAVVAGHSPNGTARTLLAHVEVADGIDAVELRRYLRSRLPSAMVPGVVRLSTCLPRLASGKVDLRGLPDAHPERGRKPDAVACTEVASAVTRYVAVELGVATPALSDDFFELGGDSLSAVRLLARLRERFGIELSLRDIFDHPTVGDLSGHIESVAGLGAAA